jgi:hypothetical protein
LSGEERLGTLRTVETLRAVLYGALVVAFLGFGCGPRSCSCGKLPKRLMVSERPAARVFSDVQMLGDGSLPRIELRVARWTGLRYRVVLEGSGSLSLEGQPQTLGPVVVTTLLHEVLRGSADPLEIRTDAGLMRLIEERAVVENVQVRQEGMEQQTLDDWNRALVPLRGSALRQGVTESAGIAWLKAELVGGARPPPAVRNAVDATLEGQRHFPFRLPAVPVGIGARWRFHEDILLNGVRARQISEMSLRAIDATSAVVSIVLRQEAPSQEVPHPLVPGAKAMLDQFQGEGQGEVTVDRLTAIVLRGRLISTSRLTLSGDVNGVHGSATLFATSIITARGSVVGESEPYAPTDIIAPDGSARD